MARRGLRGAGDLVDLSAEEQAKLKARQGVAYELQEDVLVLDPDTRTPVPWDGRPRGRSRFAAISS